jgi:hypothetical protein
MNPRTASVRAQRVQRASRRITGCDVAERDKERILDWRAGLKVGIVAEGSLEWALRSEGQYICHASVGGASGTDVWQTWELERHER